MSNISYKYQYLSFLCLFYCWTFQPSDRLYFQFHYCLRNRLFLLYTHLLIPLLFPILPLSLLHFLPLFVLEMFVAINLALIMLIVHHLFAMVQMFVESSLEIFAPKLTNAILL